jgi:hypothetical protein
MNKHFVAKVALAVASAFALAFALPAFACDKDCGCAHMKGAKADKHAADKAAPAPKADTKQAPAVPAAPEKKAGAASVGSGALAAGCDCEKGGKNCTCPKGECKCKNCEKPPKKAA